MSEPSNTPTPRKLIFFLDGTSNEDTLQAKGKWTNIVRIRDQIDSGANCLWWYSAGVAAKSNSWKCSLDLSPVHHLGGMGFIERMTELVWGKGTLLRVTAAYKWLCQQYKPGDDIYLFGFSRGAFSARCLAGIISYAGIIDPTRIYCDALPPERNSASATRLRDLQKAFGVKDLDTAIRLAINTACNACRVGLHPIKPGVTGWPIYHWSQTFLESLGCAPPGTGLSYPSMTPPDFRLAFSHRPTHGHHSVAHHHLHIRMVGVFDTVPAMGHDDMQWFDPSLREHIDSGFHALALDEPRSLFQPLLWDLDGSRSARNRPMQQAWFAGEHSDVGGGWEPKDSATWIVVEFEDGHKPVSDTDLDISPDMYTLPTAAYPVFIDENGQHPFPQWVRPRLAYKPVRAVES